MNADKFTMYNVLIDLPEAVNQICKIRAGAHPVDHWVEASAVTIEGRQLKIAGLSESYRLTEFALRSLLRLLGAPAHAVQRKVVSTERTVEAVNSVLQAGGRRLCVRCGYNADGGYVRAVFGSLAGMVDDAKLFSGVVKTFDLSRCKVRGVWVSDIGSAIRMTFPKLLPSASKRFNLDVARGFDLVNSEVLGQATWLKGVICFPEDETAVVIPNIIAGRRSGYVEDLHQRLHEMFEADTDVVDAQVLVGLDQLREERVLGSLLKELVDARRLTHKDVYDVLHCLGKHWAYGFFADILREEDQPMSYLKFCSGLIEYAKSLDSYQRRSALEFIPNLWVERATGT